MRSATHPCLGAIPGRLESRPHFDAGTSRAMRDESTARLSTPMFVRCRVHTPADRGPPPAFRAAMARAQAATAFPVERAATSARSSTRPEPTKSTGRASGDDDAQTTAAVAPSSLAVVAADNPRVAPIVDTHVPTRWRPRRTWWVAGAAAAAAVVAALSIPTVITVTTPLPTKPPSPAQDAAALRSDALAVCDAQRYRECAERLDEARALDPKGEQGPELMAARRLLKAVPHEQ